LQQDGHATHVPAS